MLTDIGANLTHDAFRHDLDDVLARARAAGVGRILVTGTTVEESQRAVQLAEDKGLHATAGVHPHHAKECGPQTIPALREHMAQINPDELTPREALELLYRLKKL